MDEVLEIASLGRTANLGDVYDARTNKFIPGLSIFQKTIPQELIESIDNPTLTYDMFVSDKISTKLQKLDITAEMKLSVLCGLINVKGSASYIDEKKQSSYAFQYSLIQKITTVDEKINIQHEDLAKCLTKTVGDDGTHVVVGISYGANTAVTLTDENEERLDHNHLKGNFEAAMKFIAMTVKGKASGDFEHSEYQKFSQTKLTVHADIVPSELSFPSNLNEAKEFLNGIPKNLGNKNKGKQLKFHLMPLSMVTRLLGVQIKSGKLLLKIELCLIQQVESIFDEIETSRQKIEDLEKELNKYDACVKRSDLERLQQFKKQFGMSLDLFLYNTGIKLIEVRSGETKPIELEKCIEEYQNNHDIGVEHVNKFIAEFDPILHKIGIYRRIISTEINYINNHGDLTFFHHDFPSQEKLILFYTFDSVENRFLRKFTFTRQGEQNLSHRKFVIIDTNIYENVTEKIPNVTDKNGLYRHYKGDYINQEIETYSLEEILEAINKTGFTTDQEFIAFLAQSIHEAFKPDKNIELRSDAKICQYVKESLEVTTKHYWHCEIFRDDTQISSIGNCIKLKFEDGTIFVAYRRDYHLKNNGFDENSKIIMLDEEEIKAKRFKLTYDCISDIYSREYSSKRNITGWRSLIFSEQNIQKYYENDFHMVYLCRNQNNSVGTISWKIDLTGINIKNLKIYLRGIVTFWGSLIKSFIKFRSLNICMDEINYETGVKSGSEVILNLDLLDIKAVDGLDLDLLEIQLELSGGRNDPFNFIMAQLFRSNVDKREFSGPDEVVHTRKLANEDMMIEIEERTFN